MTPPDTSTLLSKLRVVAAEVVVAALEITTLWNWPSVKTRPSVVPAVVTMADPPATVDSVKVVV